jgi:hypothetical protein
MCHRQTGNFRADGPILPVADNPVQITRGATPEPNLAFKAAQYTLTIGSVFLFAFRERKAKLKRLIRYAGPAPCS